MTRLNPERVSPAGTDYNELKSLVRSGRTEQWLVMRARIILLALKGFNNRKIARELNICRDTVRKWKRRWLASDGGDVSVKERLQDAPRSGAPCTFTPEQLTHVFAIACEPPADSGRPISQWTNRELADEMQEREIVSSISERHVGRLLAEADIKPHQIPSPKKIRRHYKSKQFLLRVFSLPAQPQAYQPFHRSGTPQSTPCFARRSGCGTEARSPALRSPATGRYSRGGRPQPFQRGSSFRRQ